ncbi:amidophosphoribosyltransferase [Ammoniphilus resinae]|uniref:Amidophosphoribosyltransferase n=1 Tax=Ammoniphilus resinae TaxID=861532 RepID=A0ABS4GIK3_9BACL|nr:amidophosphoribosyltransferase [Ammoniphilus resinae]MBP1930074.1 amidophosphoribosyltransferase [Ammoniphilus resinae]
MFDDVIWDKLNEECGVFGVFGHADAPQLTYYGIHALQHRGQESAGICASDGKNFSYHRGMGLVTEAFGNDELDHLRGHIAIGHVRYTTAGESKIENAQPLIFKYSHGNLALAHNGNLVNAKQVRHQLERQGSIFQTTSDTEVVAHLIARSGYDKIEEAVKESLRMIKGAYALLIMTEKKMIVALDPNGLRPLSLAKLGDAYVVSSETCAFDIVGATYLREVEPGEMVVIDEDGLRSERVSGNTQRAICSFEYIYFARPDSDIDGINVHTARKRLGRELAAEAPVEADVVTGVPDSSISAAIGYAEATGIPYELGLIKNRYVGRTFIQPSQELRAKGVRMKLSAVRKVVEGKRVVMIDDSIVRGTTSGRIVQMLRDAGAKEVHVRISSPPVMNSCFYGIDTSTRAELIAAKKNIEEMRQFIGADSLAFLSIDGLMRGTGRNSDHPNNGHCLACFTGQYPTEIYEEIEDESESENHCESLSKS